MMNGMFGDKVQSSRGDCGFIFIPLGPGWRLAAADLGSVFKNGAPGLDLWADPH